MLMMAIDDMDGDERCRRKRQDKVENDDDLQWNWDDVTGFDEADQMTGEAAYARSPLIRRANWISLGIMVTLLAWMAQRLVSSNRPTR